ncbi:hypothetical protein F511_43064 [Dorcoceras hygrometricum]|uniref:Uncharacterized protein n=1 Tax=Dorcoceras hygrometricum TaxID=472368 RepID=A0A2Z7CC00_9LAMI|nr:hypothetical protein F511_43064 [Dorcoceras hygrometricum]
MAPSAPRTRAAAALRMKQIALDNQIRTIRRLRVQLVGIRIAPPGEAAEEQKNRFTTGDDIPSSACNRRTDEICTDGFSSSNWPKRISGEEGGDGGDVGRRPAEAI